MLVSAPRFLFLSTLSLRRATCRIFNARCGITCNFYPRSPCGERRQTRAAGSCRCAISIHALLAESDWTKIGNFDELFAFLSTLSLRRATYRLPGTMPLACYFYPRSPCGERLQQAIAAEQTARISIHALLAESDLFLRSGPMMRRYFYPRSPCGERLGNTNGGVKLAGISIHALLAESDEIPARHRHAGGISIHALLAESDTIFAVRPYDAPIFLSTLSLRRATTGTTSAGKRRWDFYPRSPCGERPGCPGLGCLKQRDFYPRSPCGERPSPKSVIYLLDISIHALLAESDLPRSRPGWGFPISIHALLAESDSASIIQSRLRS